MKFCSRCGKELVDEAVVCTNCGCSVAPITNAAPKNAEDNPSILLCAVAILCPLFGLIYWAITRKDTPLRAGAVGVGALISFALSFVLSAALLLLSF